MNTTVNIDPESIEPGELRDVTAADGYDWDALADEHIEREDALSRPDEAPSAISFRTLSESRFRSYRMSGMVETGAVYILVLSNGDTKRAFEWASPIGMGERVYIVDPELTSEFFDGDGVAESAAIAEIDLDPYGDDKVFWSDGDEMYQYR